MYLFLQIHVFGMFAGLCVLYVIYMIQLSIPELDKAYRQPAIIQMSTDKINFSLSQHEACIVCCAAGEVPGGTQGYLRSVGAQPSR